jgi:hypothetical protein
MKIINSIMVLVLTSLSVLAQTTDLKKQFCDDVMRDSYIFEGKVISQHNYKVSGDENRYRSYTSYIVEVTKVVKGNIQKGTVNILKINGISAEGAPFILPDEGLYFCDKDSSVKDSSVANTNSKSLEYYCGDSMSNGELKKDNNDNLIDYFPSIKDFYDYISENYGVTIK